MDEQYYINAITELDRQLRSTNRRLSNADLSALANTIYKFRTMYPDSSFKAGIHLNTKSHQWMGLYIPFSKD